MNIAIQRGLEDLRKQLENRGHKVFYIGEENIADAVLYMEVDNHPYYEVNNVSSAATSAVGDNIGYGALLVNVTNKSFDEIEGILYKRIYSPLF